MTKPSDFIMNTDYLTIAQASKMDPFTVIFPPQLFPATAEHPDPYTTIYTLHPFHSEQEIIAPTLAGAIDRFIIEYNSQKYVANQLMRSGDITISGGNYAVDQGWLLTIFRKDANKIVVRCDYSPPTKASSIPSSPSLTFKISVTSFRPPNVL